MQCVYIRVGIEATCVVELRIGSGSGVVGTTPSAGGKSTSRTGVGRRAAWGEASRTPIRTSGAGNGLNERVFRSELMKQFLVELILTHPEEMVQANASQLESAVEISIPTL